jgi:carboxymethylenebutenolidase
MMARGGTMGRWVRGAVVLSLSFFALGCKRPVADSAKTEEADLPRGTEVVSFSSGGLGLRGLLLRPAGRGPFPAVLYNHGSAPGMANHLAFANIAPVFVAHGWVFFMPYRRGQGLSASAGRYIGDEIEDAKRKGGLEAAVSVQLRLLDTEQLDDQLAALEWLRHRSFVQDRIAAAGNSFGGIEAVFGAERGGYCAAVDAAGAAESWAQSPALRERMTRAARNAKVPIFFLQAENDFDLSPTRTLALAMEDAGKRSEMKIYPAFGSTTRDGHSFAYRGVASWADDVIGFLGRACDPKAVTDTTP